jgi:aspartyl-tRNA(Asn)/glutamyl-tRNA(Gln) amidotransferase subunit A
VTATPESLLGAGVAAIASAVREGRMRARSVVEASFARAREVDAGPAGLNCILTSDLDASLSAVESAPVGGELAGVPFVLKDNIATTTLSTSCGSRILEGYVSPYDSTVARKLREAGAILVGKANMDEFAMGSSTEFSAYGPARNPVDRSRVPGGSSGGSASAVAAGIVPIALGSETGGSVRQPAAFCGIVGVKPTYGRISRFGLVAFASSLDNIGVFGRTVDDAARAMECISGIDTIDDATSAPLPAPIFRADASAAGVLDLHGVVIGKPAEYFPPSLPAAMRAQCERALEALRARGATIRDVSLPHTDLALPVYYIIAPAECSANLARFDGVRYGLRLEGDGLRGMYEATRSRGFGAEVTRRILLGTYVLSAGYYDAYYKKAMDVRALIARDFARVFASGVHALFTPTTAAPAFEIGAISDPYEMYLCDLFTVAANLAEVPAISVPIGRIGGLPVGGQLIAPRFGEREMFRISYALEAELGQEAHT